MSEAAWLEWRRRGVGSSDAPAILGVCPHRTRLAVYLDKVRPRVESKTETQGSGNDLEPLIAQWYTRRTGFEIVQTQHLVECELFPWMRASVDCIRSDGRPVELKALGVYKANNFQARDGDWQALPENYIVQCHHQMIVMDCDVIDVAVFYPLELRTYTVPRSEKLCNLIVDLTGELWECVCDRTPPRTVDSRDHERLDEAYPRAEGEIELASPAWLDDVHQWFVAKDKAAKVRILDAMGEAASATLADGSILRRDEKRVEAYTVPAKTRITLKLEKRPVHAVSE